MEHMLRRRSSGGGAKNQLLNLAFEPAQSTYDAQFAELTPSETPRSVPNAIFRQGVVEHAELLGMAFPGDEPYLWIAEESLLAPLPDGWMQLRDDASGHPYYSNQITGESSWEHPRDGFYRTVFQKKKAEAAAAQLTSRSRSPAVAAAAWRSNFQHQLSFRSSEDLEGDLLDDIMDSSEELNTARYETDKLKAELTKQKSLKETLVTRKEEQIVKLLEEKAELETKIDQLEESLMMEREKSRLAAVQEKQQQKLKEKQQRERAQHDRRVKELEEQVGKLEAQLDEENKRAGDVVVEADELRGLLQAKEALLKALEKNRDSRQAAATSTAAEAKQQDNNRLGALATGRQQLEEERERLAKEVDQMKAKMNFEISERVKDVQRRNDNTIASLERQIAELKGELDVTKAQARAAEEDLERSRKEAEVIREAAQLAPPALVEDIRAELRELKMKLVEAEEKHDVVMRELADKDVVHKQIGVLKREKEDIQEALKESQSKFSEQIAVMNEELADKEAALEEKMAVEMRLTQQVEDLAASKMRITAALEDEMQVMRRGKARLEADEAAMTQKLKQQSDKMALMASQLTIMPELEASLQKLSIENASITTELEGAREKVEKGQNLLDSLRVQLAEAQGTMTVEKRASSLWGDKTSTMERELVQAKAAVAAASVELEAMRGAVEKVTKRENELLEMQKKKTHAVSQETASAFERERQLYVNRAEGAEKRCDKLQGQMELMEEKHAIELNKAKEREQDMWGQLQKMSANFASAAQLTAAAAASNTPQMDEENARLKVKVESLSKQADESAAKLAEASRTEKDALREKEQCQRDVKLLQEEVEQTKEKLAKRKEKANQMKVRLEGECQDLYTQVQKAKVNEATLRVQVDQLSEKNKALTLESEEARDSRERGKAGAEVRSVMEAQLSMQSESMIAMQQQMASLRQELSDSEVKRRKTEDELATTRVRLAVMETEKESIEGKLERLKLQYREMEERSRAALIDHEMLINKTKEAKAAAQKAQAEVEEWKRRCDAERQLRRQLHEKVLDLQGSIRVFCRLRPLHQQELLAIQGDGEYDDPLQCVKYPDFDKLDFYGTGFEFDQVFCPGTNQEQIFNEVQPVVAAALNGYRVCVFAYGQTGSGKTFTMEGPKSDRGVNFRALKELFELARADPSKEYQFTCSMLEVYNEKIKDLFIENNGSATARSANNNADNDNNNAEIHMDKRGNIYVNGLVEVQVQASEEVEDLISLGSTNRTVGNNNVHLHSSRSHLVLQVAIAIRDKSSGQLSYGKLNLIDLAGSERIKSTAAEGQRLKEAQNINRSLSALGDVIAALGCANSKHIPYRNSKLTFLLQDSLSAASKVLMFVNINPAPQSQNESICSLNFAKRCKAVQLGQARKIAAAPPSSSSSSSSSRR